MRLIDADDAKRTYTKDMFDTEEDFERVNDVLNYAPTVDAVSVVRCKDCKMWGKQNIFEHSDAGRMRRGGYCMCSRFTRYEDDFCSSGEYQTNVGGVKNVVD